FTKLGTGRLTLAAGGTYAGATSVAAGELRVNGPLSSPTIAVAANTLLSGTGPLPGAVTLDNAATLAPGNASVGTLTLGSLTTSGGSSLIWEFNTNPANDLVVVTTPNGLTINGGAFSLYSEGTNTPFGTVGTYNLFQYSGAVQGSGVNSLAVANPAAGKNYTFGDSGGFVTLTIAASGLLAQWNVDAGGTWTTAANWTPSEPNGAADTATFGSVITAPRTVTLNAPRTIGNVVFNNVNAYTIAPAAAQTLTIGDGTGTKLLQVVSGSHTIAAPVALASNVGVDVVAGQTLALTGPVSGVGTLTKTSGGTLRLTGSNTYTGNTTVSAGAIEFTAGAISSGVLTLDGGGVRYAAGNTEDLSSKTVNLAFGGGTVNTGGNDVTFANSIGNGGSGGLTKSGSGTLTLQGANTYTGKTTVSSGVLSVAADSALGDVGTAAGIVVDSGTLRATTGFTTARGVTTASGGGLDVPGAADTLTINGVVTGAGMITKTGSGTVLLAGANTAFTGGMTLAEGAVTLGGGIVNGFQGLGTGTVTFQNGAVLNLNGYASSPGSTSYGTLTNPLVVAAGQSGTMTLPGRCVISSTLTGSGTLGVVVQYVRDDFSGNWSGFTGQINVTSRAGQGDFRLNNTSGFGTAAINLGPGVAMYPVINYVSSPTTFTIGELSGDATAVVTGQGGVNSGRIALYSVGGRNTDATFAGTIRDGVVTSATQPAAITKVGTGVWTLTGTNTFTGATVVNGGTLYVATPNGDTGGLAQTASITINNGGTLRSSANALFGWNANQGKDITVNAGGTLTADNGADVHVRRVTLNGGVLANSGSSVDWGSWVFDGADTILAVTETSTASAVNVRFQNGGSIDVAATKTLQFAGTITDSGSAGASALIKTGSGTLSLNGASTYTGPTTVSAGTLFANTNLRATAITTAAGAVLGGSGTAGSVTMSAGALVAPGDGVGKFTINDSLVLTGSSGYLWQLTNATGTAGSASGWDLLTVTGTLSIAATSADPFQIDLWTVSSANPVTSGSAANFNREQSYTWKIATAAGGITGFASNKFVINTSATNGAGGFANTFTGGTFSLAQSGNDLNLVFTGAAPSVITINVASGTQTQTQAGYPSLSGSTPVLKTGAGTLVVDQANTLTGSTTVQGGVLRLADGAALGSSKVVPLAGGTLALSPYLQTTVGGLAPNAGGLTDVGSGMVTVAAGLSAADMVAAIVSGMGDGTWNGTSGITSSVAAASGGDRTVGWLDNGGGSVTFAFAAAGDTNLDWQVDIIDAANFLAGGKFDSGSPATWNEGDFTYDGVVDILDAASFLSNGLFDAGSYNPPPGQAGVVAAVPEPSVTLIGLAGLLAGFAVRFRRQPA
ncbi:MAG: autotransporter-associated beta strand repeat-containing protein, partial [Planctomycetes bacterium]|nr:autotransporter-associated beta strand repeat-containing protein [Planctomycetota bacterium]